MKGFSSGDKVWILINGKWVAGSVEHDQTAEVVYVSYDHGAGRIYMFVDENDLLPRREETDSPQANASCECGVVHSPSGGLHSSWCPLYETN